MHNTLYIIIMEEEKTEELKEVHFGKFNSKQVIIQSFWSLKQLRIALDSKMETMNAIDATAPIKYLSSGTTWESSMELK